MNKQMNKCLRSIRILKSNSPCNVHKEKLTGTSELTMQLTTEGPHSASLWYQEVLQEHRAGFPSRA